MNKDDAASLLLQRSCITSDKIEAMNLIEMVGRLPLAIEQAASYIRETGISIGKYENLFQSNALELLKKGLPTNEYYQKTGSYNLEYLDYRYQRNITSCECYITDICIFGWERNPERTVLWCLFNSCQKGSSNIRVNDY